MAISYQVGVPIGRKWLVLAIACLLSWMLFLIPASLYPTQAGWVPVVFIGFVSAVVLTITCIIYGGHVNAHARIRNRLATLPVGYIILHDIRLDCGKAYRLIDHLVIAPSGVWLIKVIPGANRVYGSEQDERWSTHLFFPWQFGERRWRIINTPNLALLFSPCCDRVHDLLMQDTESEIPIHLTFIYPGTETHITASFPILNTGEELVSTLANGEAILNELDREKIAQTILRQHK